MSNSSDEDKASHEATRIRSSQSHPSRHLFSACDILGYSTRSRSSLAKNRASTSTPHMSKNTLQLFFKRYPRGTVFSFDRDGMISSSEEEPPHDQLAAHEITSSFMRKESGNSNSKRQRRRDAAMISEMIPGVRSVAFCPLWDYSRDHWYAASLAWSMDPSRTLDEEELAYFAAFGNSAMAEVSRLEAVVADHTKSNFISSISHEMRSPLHGVLGNTELLRDTTVSPAQNELIDMIEVCGRTLLDTMDHL
jgi:His Kinase A (phospho-acceptor) domain